MATRPILGLISIVDGLRKLGEDVTPVLARHGIDLDHVDPSAHIDRALELRIYVEVAEVLQDPLAGLRAGTNVGIGSYGPFVMLVMTCENAWEAFRIGVQYQQLTYLYGTLRLEPGAHTSTLVLAPMPLPPRAFRFRVDGEVVQLVQRGVADQVPPHPAVPRPEVEVERSDALSLRARPGDGTIATRRIALLVGTVIVFANDPTKWAEDSRFVRSVRPDQQGQYEIKGLPAGEYLAVAVDYVAEGMWNDPEYLEGLRRYAQRVTLTEGDARAVTLKLTTIETQ